MTAQQAYKEFLLKINKNDTNTNVHISKANFVIYYNQQAQVYVREKIISKGDNTEINDLDVLLVVDKPLILVDNKDLYTIFELPQDYFDIVSSYSIAKKDECSGRILYNWNMKPKNRNVLLANTNTKPSFEYEETYIQLSDFKLLVFTDNFEIEKQFLTYYRIPRAIDLKGYQKLDGSQSIDIDPDMPDIQVNEILNRCAIEVIRSYENPEGFQLAKDRLSQE